MKKTFVFALVSALILTGIIAIYAVLSGDFSEVQARILITTVSVFFYSIIGLCCNTLMGGKYEKFGYLGIIASVLGLLFAIYHTWSAGNGFNVSEHIQLRSSLFFIGLAFAHASLMLLISPKNAFVAGAVWIALACNLIFTFIILIQILSFSGATMVQFQIILAIINVIATITAPLVNRFS